MPVRYSRARNTVWRRSHGRVLVRPLAEPEIVALTGTGEDLWELLVDQLTVDELADGLAETYGVAPTLISRDIEPILDDLAARGVVDRTEAA